MAAFQLVEAGGGLFSLVAMAEAAPSEAELAAAQRVTALFARLGQLRDAGREADAAALASFRQGVAAALATDPSDPDALSALAVLDIEPMAQRLFPGQPYRIGEALLKPLFTLSPVSRGASPSAAQQQAAAKLRAVLIALDRRIGAGGVPWPDRMAALRDRAERALTYPTPDGTAVRYLVECVPEAEAAAMFSRLEVRIEDSGLEPSGGQGQPRPRSVTLAAEVRDPSMLRIRYNWGPDVMLSVEEQALYTELLKAEFLLRAICLDPRRRLPRLSTAPGQPQAGLWRDLRAAAARVVNLYSVVVFWWNRSDVFRRLLLRLKFIAGETLVPSPPRVELAAVLLQGLQEDARLAVVRHGKTKRVLGFFGALLCGLLVIGLFLHRIGTGPGQAAICSDLELTSCKVSWHAMVYFTGTAIGAWLSFVQRNLSAETLRAEQDLEALRSLLADTMNPLVRAAYIFGFAFIVLLLLHEKILQISFGPNVDLAKVLVNGHVALLAGLLIGLAERTLPTMVARPVQALGAAPVPVPAANPAPGAAPVPAAAGQ